MEIKRDVWIRDGKGRTYIHILWPKPSQYGSGHGPRPHSVGRIHTQKKKKKRLAGFRNSGCSTNCSKQAGSVTNT